MSRLGTGNGGSKLDGTSGDIAERLLQEHGLDQALQVAMAETYAAQESGDNLDLSTWRDVRRILRECRDSAT